LTTNFASSTLCAMYRTQAPREPYDEPTPRSGRGKRWSGSLLVLVAGIVLMDLWGFAHRVTVSCERIGPVRENATFRCTEELTLGPVPLRTMESETTILPTGLGTFSPDSALDDSSSEYAAWGDRTLRVSSSDYGDWLALARQERMTARVTEVKNPRSESAWLSLNVVLVVAIVAIVVRARRGRACAGR
jgi:hypothetical protein